MFWIAVWGLAVVPNAIPAFMPPTWAVLAYFHLYHGPRLSRSPSSACCAPRQAAPFWRQAAERSATAYYP